MVTLKFLECRRFISGEGCIKYCMGENKMAAIGRSIKPGFLKRPPRGKFLRGTIKQFGNKKGIVKKVR
jgi:hypothetical protein